MIRANNGTIKAGTALYRVADPAFGLTFKRVAPAPFRGGRFDCTDGTYGYTYLADSPEVALAEVFTRDLAPSTVIRTMPASRLTGAVMQTVETTIDLQVQLLHGKHLSVIGETVALTKSDPCDYERTRAVASKLIGSNPSAHGLRYRPRHDEDGFAFLLYSTDPGRELGEYVSRVADDQPLHEGEGLERASLLLAHYNVSVER